MNNIVLEKKVKEVAAMLWQQKGYASPVDVLIKMGFLSERNYKEWRNGRVQYLEKVITANLNKLSTVMKILRDYSVSNGAKPSFSYYRQNGTGNSILRFSKSGKSKIERSYATNYVLKPDKTAELQLTDNAIEES